MKRLALLVPLLSLLAVPAASGADSACKPLEDAGLKASQQPRYHVVTESAGERTELIALDDVTYMNVGRGWVKLPVKAQEAGKASAEYFSGGEESKLHDCRKLGAETVDGIATTVYAYKIDTPAVELFGKKISEAQTTEGKFYLGKDGLPYAHTSDDTKQRWKYIGITAPKQ